MTRPTKPPEPSSPATDPAGLAKTLSPGDPGTTTQVDPEPNRDAAGDEGESIASGSRIGRFRLLDKLGEGGMGVVFAARDEQLDRKIAIKLLLPGMKKGRERLLREARALARLTHPNVVTVHDVGTLGERVYVAMEFVEGVTLTEWLKESPPWTEVLRVFLQAADGLAAAHDAGIVHRDFKPDNVLVGRDDRVRVLDFGLAKGGGLALDSVGDHPLSNPEAPLDQQNLTRTGSMMGTPAYMAPEQFLGTDVDARTDQFAFCIALFEGLYGVRPFAGTNLTDLARAVTQGLMISPPADRSIPAPIHKVLGRGLSPRREDRFASMRELRRALTRAQREEPSSRSPRWPAALGLAALLGVGAIGVWLYDGLSSGRRDETSEGEPTPAALAPLMEDDGAGEEDDEPAAAGNDEPVPSPEPPPRKEGAPAVVLGNEPAVGDSPLPSVTDCPAYQPPPRAPASAERQLKFLTTAMATQPLKGEALLETLTSLTEHHQRNGDEASACSVAQRFLALTPSEHPGRWDMMCLERQLDCRSRLGRAKLQGSTSWTQAEEARAPDSTLDGPARDKQLRTAVDGLERACRSGDAHSCLRAAEILEDPDEAVHDRSRALTQYRRACRMGELDGCAPLRSP